MLLCNYELRIYTEKGPTDDELLENQSVEEKMNALCAEITAKVEAFTAALNNDDRIHATLTEV